MTDTRKPAKKSATTRKIPGTTHVFRTPVVEMSVSARCVHGCYVVTPTMPTLWWFTGITDPVEAGPGCEQTDIVIHTHLDDDLEEPCVGECWTDEDGE